MKHLILLLKIKRNSEITCANKEKKVSSADVLLSLKISGRENDNISIDKRNVLLF